MVEINGYSTDAPCSVESFQAELDRACRDNAIQLRIKWAPSLIARKIGPRTFKKYPDPLGQFDPYLKGYYFIRDKRVVGYQKIGGIIQGDVKDTDIVQPHIEYEQPAIALWIIEQKLQDQVARREHAKYRELIRQQVGFDAWGPFPEEGWWNWFDDISQHKDGCCDRAEAAQIRCRGVYREPDASDLEKVRQALLFRNRLPVLRRLEDPPTALEIDQYARDYKDAVEEWEAKELANQKQELAENIALGLKPMMTPSVYHDPAKRDPRLQET